MQPITLSAPTITEGLVRVPVDPGDAAPFVTRRDLLFDYGGVDLTEVNPADGLLPALGAVLPAAIALGVPVSAPVFDSAFAEAAPRIAEAFRSMYRGFAPGGFNLIGPHATISHLFTAVDKAVLLYSGGLNSATSLLRYAPDVECLLGVWGVDSDPEDAEVWRMFRSTIAAAPSLIVEALAAVMVPSLAKAGRNLPNWAGSPRPGSSSWATMEGSPLRWGTSTGVISRSKAPLAMAARARS